MTKPIPHGTLSGYTYHKCRCDLCKAAKAQDNKRYRLARKLEEEGYWQDTAPIETDKYRDLVEEALGAFLLDPDYVVRMTQAADSARSLLPQAQ